MMASPFIKHHALAQTTGWPDFMSNEFNLIQQSGSLYSREDKGFLKELFGQCATLYN